MKRLPLMYPVAVGMLCLVVSCGEPAQEAAQPYAPAIDAARFVASVDNRYFPLVPGTAFVYETPDGGERVEVAVTEETKTIMGVTCIVVMSREFEDGELVEETADRYAQDSFNLPLVILASWLAEEQLQYRCSVFGSSQRRWIHDPPARRSRRLLPWPIGPSRLRS